MSVDYGTTAHGAKRLFAGTSVPGRRMDIGYAPAHVRFFDHSGTGGHSSTAEIAFG